MRLGWDVFTTVDPAAIIIIIILVTDIDVGAVTDYAWHVPPKREEAARGG